MGTFELNNDKFVNVLAERKITCILTGHSHRRGLYFLGDLQQTPRGRAVVRSLPVTIHDPENYQWDSRDGKAKQRQPAIIVSDSAGPFPRYNERGEFLKWGSDKPGGTIVKFAADGTVREVEVIRSGAKAPRLAVSLDYADVEQGGLVWEHPIRTTVFAAPAEAKAMRDSIEWYYVFEFALRREMIGLGLTVREVRLFAAGASKPALTLTVGANPSVKVGGAEARNFFDWTRQTQAGGLFAAVTFRWNSPLAQRYDIRSAWIYEVLPVRVPIRGAMAQCRYELTRPLRSTDGKASLIKYADLPDFERRRRAAAGHDPPNPVPAPTP